MNSEIMVLHQQKLLVTFDIFEHVKKVNYFKLYYYEIMINQIKVCKLARKSLIII